MGFFCFRWFLLDLNVPQLFSFLIGSDGSVFVLVLAISLPCVCVSTGRVSRIFVSSQAEARAVGGHVIREEQTFLNSSDPPQSLFLSLCFGPGAPGGRGHSRPLARRVPRWFSSRWFPSRWFPSRFP